MRGKPSNCKCGNFKEAGSRWVVIQRRPGSSSHLKCLECGWKWWNSCRYTTTLPDHVERKRSGCTNEDILNRLLQGNLKIDPVTSRVYSNLRGGEWKELSQVACPNNGGYRFVKVCWGGRQKKIAVHVLQFMQYLRELIPDDMDVHHKGSPPRPYPKNNALDNLELLESKKNRNGSFTPDDEPPF